MSYHDEEQKNSFDLIVTEILQTAGFDESTVDEVNKSFQVWKEEDWKGWKKDFSGDIHECLNEMSILLDNNQNHNSNAVKLTAYKFTALMYIAEACHETEKDTVIEKMDLAIKFYRKAVVIQRKNYNNNPNTQKGVLINLLCDLRNSVDGARSMMWYNINKNDLEDNQNDYMQSLHYSLKAAEVKKQILQLSDDYYIEDDKYRLAETYEDIATTYSSIYTFSDNKEDLDNSLRYHDKALKLFKSLDSKKTASDDVNEKIAEVYKELSELYGWI